MDWIRLINRKQTNLCADDSGRSVSIHGTLQRPRASDAHRNSENQYHNKRHRHNKYFPTIGTLVLSLLSPTVSLAADVGGVSATANPIANSSGSVTNQAIQVLQGPYITNTYGGGIQCQGATMNITPYVTGSGAFKRPFERYYDDPVYDIHDADDDGQIDNPGNILYYVPTRTNQTENYNLSIGVSATWSKPLDKKLQQQCKEAVASQIALVNQTISNKRLDFEIARLKNCGELKQQGIMFHPKSPYYSVCADVMLINPAGVVAPHMHNLSTSSSSSAASQNLSPGDPSSTDTHSSSTQPESGGTESSQESSESSSSLSLSQVSQPSSKDQPAALLGGPIQWPPQQSSP